MKKGKFKKNKKHDAIFKTVVGSKFVDLLDVRKMIIGDESILGTLVVDSAVVEYCVVKWALRMSGKKFGLNRIRIQPLCVVMDVNVWFVIDGESKTSNKRIRLHQNSSENEILLDTKNINPLINGIVPTGVEVLNITYEIPQITIKF